ncbi:MAG: diacylglycerol kinase family protein [Bacteroidales bacterium]
MMNFTRKLRNAFRGLAYFFKYVSNAKIHLVIMVLVIAAGFLFSVSRQEWIAIILCIGGVFAAEIFNTAIELLGDLYSTEENSKIKNAKDSGAGAVLLMAIISVIVGALIFLPKILTLVMQDVL